MAEQFAKGPQSASNPAETLTTAVLHPGPLLITTLLPLFFSFLPTSQGCSEITHEKSLAHWMVLGPIVNSFKGELLMYVNSLIILINRE